MSCVERIGLHNVLLYLNTIYLHAIGQIPSRDVDKYALLTADYGAGNSERGNIEVTVSG